MKKLLISLLTLSMIGIVVCSNNTNTSALTYSDNVGLNFTFNTALTVSLSSSDIVINDLTPGTSSDSNTIIVNVLTNNANGYELKSSVGNSTTYASADRNLVLSSSLPNNVTNTTPKFSSIDYGSSLASLTTDNTWGYSYLDETLVGSTWSNYSGLPKYDDTEHIATLKTSTSPSLSTGDNIDFKIAAKASTTQTEGEYNNVINFIVVGANNPMSLYDAYGYAGQTMHNGYYTMQDMTPTICNNVAVEESQLQVIDIRDHNVYTIAKLKDDRCWLLNNLKLDLTSASVQDNLTSSTTNADDVSLNYLLNGGGSSPYATDAVTTTWTSSTDNWTVPRINTAYKDSISSDAYDQDYGWQIGIYYNFCAASAGSYCYEMYAGTDSDFYDICPVNWHIPKVGNEYQTLVDRYVNYADFRNAFHANLPGMVEWNNGVISGQGVLGHFWASTYYNSSNMYRLRVDGVSSYNPTYIYWRSSGLSVRCIANNS